MKQIHALKQSLKDSHNALHIAKSDVSLAEVELQAQMREILNNKSKTKKQQQILSSAQEQQNKVEAQISREGAQLAKIERAFTNKATQAALTQILAKFMLISNNLDEIIHAKVLDQAVSEFYNAQIVFNDAANALRHVDFAIQFIENTAIIVGSEAHTFCQQLVLSILSQAETLYRPLISIGNHEHLTKGYDFLYASQRMKKALGKAKLFLTAEVTRLRKQLGEVQTELIKASNKLASIRSKIIYSVFESCSLSPSENADVARALEYDGRELRFITDLTLGLDTPPVPGVRYVEYTPKKEDIGRAVGVLYLELGAEDEEELSDLPRYE
ncbi:hypothetical protein HDU99_000646 [Rhizoclosmatium hyalinum]|nr:hypothetical protein HDU99_000646 [Rhizoclosmatium hyalinum]